MKVEFASKFAKDLLKLDSKALHDVEAIVIQIESADKLSELTNIKKLKGFKTAYRIRTGNYRIGIVLKIIRLYLQEFFIVRRFIFSFPNF